MQNPTEQIMLKVKGTPVSKILLLNLSQWPSSNGLPLVFMCKVTVDCKESVWSLCKEKTRLAKHLVFLSGGSPTWLLLLRISLSMAYFHLIFHSKRFASLLFLILTLSLFFRHHTLLCGKPQTRQVDWHSWPSCSTGLFPTTNTSVEYR